MDDSPVGAGPAGATHRGVPQQLRFPRTQPFTRSAPQQLRLTNTGTTPLGFVITASDQIPVEVTGCVDFVDPGQSCTAELVFAPTAGGLPFFQGSVRISADQMGIELPLTVGWLPLVSDPVPPLDLGPVRDGFTSGPRTLSFENFWPDDTTITSVSFPSGSRFSIARSTCGGAIASGGTCEVDVTYAPGLHVGVDDDVHTLTGPSNAEDFAVNSFNCSPQLASGAYCDIVVVFQPTKTGAITADLIVFGPFYGQPAQEVVRLTGTGGTAANRPPAAADDTASVGLGATTTIDPRRNDSDPDAGAVLALPTIVTPPSLGSATVGADGIVIYVAPRRVASGTVVTIVYSVCDQQGACSTATIRITITSSGGLLPATGGATVTFLALAAGLVVAGVIARRTAHLRPPTPPGWRSRAGRQSGGR